MGRGVEPLELTSCDHVFGNPLAVIVSNIVSYECCLWAAGTLEIHGSAVTSDYDFASWHPWRSVRPMGVGPGGGVATIRQAHLLGNEIRSGPGGNRGDGRRR